MKKIIFFLIISSLLLSNFGFGQEFFGQESGIDLVRNKSLKIITNLIRFAFTVLMLGGSALLIFLGIKYITAKGKVEEVKELHMSLLYLIIGIVLLITSFFIPNLIKNFIESSIQ